MGTLKIELPAKAIEGALLAAAVSRGRPGSFSFQSAMHSFMSAVLLWFHLTLPMSYNAEASEPG